MLSCRFKNFLNLWWCFFWNTIFRQKPVSNKIRYRAWSTFEWAKGTVTDFYTAHILIIDIDLNLVSICWNPQLILNTGIILTYIHHWRNFKNIPNITNIALNLIDTGSKLWIPEHIHYAMIANPVTTSKISLGIVVKGTPSAGTGTITFRGNTIQNSCMSQEKFSSPWFTVKSFCREHVSIIFCNKIPLSWTGYLNLILDSLIFSIVNKIIESINILQKTAVLNASYATCWTSWIKLSGNRICACIEFIIISTLIYSHAPHKNTWMVPVLQNHITCIFNGNILPLPVTNKLPSWNLSKNQKTNFITSINKMLALRIVTCPHIIQPQFILENFCIIVLNGFRHCIPNIRIRLMPVQSPKLYLDSIQIKTAFIKTNISETKTNFLAVKNFSLFIN